MIERIMNERSFILLNGHSNGCAMKDTVQDQLIAARRHQILDAAAKVFAEKGFHVTTIRDIARTAGIADGTIYNYFASKADLLLGIFDRMRDAVQPDDAFANLDATDFRGFLRAYFRLPLMTMHGDNFALFRVIVSEMMINPELRTLYYTRILEPTLTVGEQLFHEWADRHIVRSINPRLAIRTISSMVLGLMIENIMGDSVLDAQWEELPDFLADLFLTGIGTGSGGDQP
jgi:TetR/AcrR family fatty acid metabolism transcriptional regulator